LKLLIIGDTHIPERASVIPKQITDKIESEKFDLILCTGDLEDESVMRYLSRLGKLYVSRGNMDYLTLPKEAKIDVKNFIIGLIHGDAIYPRGNPSKLAKEAQRISVDILISGHTHSLSISEIKKDDEKLLLLDPGSATGAWGGGPASHIPSFIILEIENSHATIHAFELVDNSLKERVYKFGK
jgi:putative phosphoesterase